MPRLLLITFALTTALACSKKKEEAAQVSLPPITDQEMAGYQEGAEAKREQIIKAWPEWLEHPNACPVEIMPESFQGHDFSLEECQGEKIHSCLRKCEFFDAAACYSAALILESPELAVDKLSPALFARACEYGSASACTNWTAGLVMAEAQAAGERKYSDCQERSFEASCTRGQDPWGCAMYAHALAEKGPLEADLPRIEAAAKVACRLGQDDPACQTGQGILQEITAVKAGNSPAGGRTSP
jgi:hypothetical protein